MIQQAIDFETARSQRDSGMARSLSSAERAVTGWGEIAYTFLLIYARSHSRFTAYDFRQAYHAAGKPAPITDKAFGSIFKRGAKEGVIERVGYAPHPERHLSPTVAWRSLVYTEAA